MSKFKKFELYDKMKADNGVWLELVDHNENLWGEFLVAYNNPYAKNGEITAKRIRAKYGITGKSKQSDQEIAAIFTVERFLKDWKMEGADGNEIPFSIEDAIEYLSDEDNLYALEQIIKFSDNVLNFNTENLGEVMGNLKKSSTGNSVSKSEN